MRKKRMFVIGLQSWSMLAASLAADGGSSYPAIVLAEHAVAYYRLEELPGASNAVDATASQLTGAYTFNSTGYPQLGAPGIQTNAIVFAHGPNGAADDGYIAIPWSPLVAPANADGVTGAPFSVELWINPNQGNTYDAAFQSSNSFGWFFYHNTFTNSSAGVMATPFFEPAQSAVHIGN